jgi:hypothetical protein
MKTERSRSKEHEASTRSNSNSRGRSVSVDRMGSRDRRAEFESERDDTKGESYSDDGSRGRYGTGKRNHSSRSTDRELSRERGRDRERERERDRERRRERSRDRIRVEESATKGEVQAMQLELYSIRDDMQRSSLLQRNQPAPRRDRERDREVRDPPVRPEDRDPDRLLSLVTTLRKELDVSERACHAATRRGNDCCEELKYKSDEVTRLQELLDNCKSDNKRMTRELRSLREDADYSGRDNTSTARLEVDKLKAEASALHSKVEQLLTEQQRSSFCHRGELEAWKIERDRLTAQLTSLMLSAGSSQDISALQVQKLCYAKI